MTEAPAAYIDATEEQVATLLATAEASDRPVSMINLLRFREDGGRESYLRYGTEVQPLLDAVGATIDYAGNCGEVVIGADSEAWWDSILVVRYPSRAAFLKMVLSPEYQEVAVHRTHALETSALIATETWDFAL